MVATSTKFVIRFKVVVKKSRSSTSTSSRWWWWDGWEGVEHWTTSCYSADWTSSSVFGRDRSLSLIEDLLYVVENQRKLPRKKENEIEREEKISYGSINPVSHFLTILYFLFFLLLFPSLSFIWKIRVEYRRTNLRENAREMTSSTQRCIWWSIASTNTVFLPFSRKFSYLKNDY